MGRSDLDFPKSLPDFITYRKANRRRAINNREGLIQKEREREIRQEADIAEAEQVFTNENRDAIDAA